MEASEKVPGFSRKKILLPVALGIGISLYLILSSAHPGQLKNIPFTWHLPVGLLLAVLAVLTRDIAYIYRIRQLTGKKLSWFKSFEVTMLWEFGSAVTPGAVGGIALAVFVLKREGVSYGRSTAIIMLSSLLDNLAFVLMYSILFAVVGQKMFLVSPDCSDLQGRQILQSVGYIANKAWIGFAVLSGAAVFLSIAMFVVPQATKNFFSSLAGFRLLKRFAPRLQNLGREIEISSIEFKNAGAAFYLRTFAATMVSWVARYLLANAIIFSVSDLPLNQLEVLARQYVLWPFIIIPFTPGASGVAEIFFQVFNCQFMPPYDGLPTAATFVWRMYSYYIYLLIGMIVLPRWLARTAKPAVN